MLLQAMIATEDGPAAALADSMMAETNADGAPEALRALPTPSAHRRARSRRACRLDVAAMVCRRSDTSKDGCSRRRRRRASPPPTSRRTDWQRTAAAIDRAGVGAFKIKSQTGTVAVEGLQSSGRRANGPARTHPAGTHQTRGSGGQPRRRRGCPTVEAATKEQTNGCLRRRRRAGRDDGGDAAAQHHEQRSNAVDS